MMNRKSTMAAFALVSFAVLQGCVAPSALAEQPGEIPRAASTPDTPKNWVAPGYKIFAQTLIDEIEANHPELVSATMHAVPPGEPAEAYTMIAGTFPDRIGNMSSPGDIITAKKGVSQVESKWGTDNYGKKVSIVLPLRDKAGNYLPVSLVIAFKQWPTSGLIDTDFLAPGLRIREDLAPRIDSTEALFATAE